MYARARRSPSRNHNSLKRYATKSSLLLRPRPRLITEGGDAVAEPPIPGLSRGLPVLGALLSLVPDRASVKAWQWVALGDAASLLQHAAQRDTVHELLELVHVGQRRVGADSHVRRYLWALRSESCACYSVSLTVASLDGGIDSLRPLMDLRVAW